MPKIKQKNDEPTEEPQQDKSFDDMQAEAAEHNQNEVTEMLESMGAVDEQEEPEEPETPEPKGEEEQEEEESPQQPEGSDEEEEDVSKDEIIERLRNQVNELSQREEEEEQPEEPKGEEEEQPEELQEEQVVEFDAQEFVSEEEFDDIIQDRSKLNEVLNRVALESANAAREAILRQLPDIVDKTTTRQMTMRQSIQKFYADNPDLRDYGSYVGHIATKIKAEKPDAPMITVLNEAGEEARKKLGIQKEAEETEEKRREQENDKQDNNDQPAFAKRGTGPRSGGKNDDRSDFAKQADEMLKSIPGR